MNKKILITASSLGLIAIILGAYGAHGLKPKLSPDQFDSLQTGVTYQMYHALFLLLLGGSIKVSPKLKQKVFYLIFFGVLCFSGSIYLLSTNDLSPINFKFIWFITPLGGLLLILGWVFLLFGFFKLKETR